MPGTSEVRAALCALTQTSWCTGGAQGAPAVAWMLFMAITIAVLPDALIHETNTETSTEGTSCLTYVHMTPYN